MLEKPSLILAKKVAASILDYPERMELTLDRQMSYNYNCKWSHPLNGANIYFKDYGDDCYTCFSLYFLATDQTVNRIYLEETERQVIIDAWKEASRIQKDNRKVVKEAKRQIKAQHIIEEYFKT